VRGPLDTGLLVLRVGAGLSLLVLLGIHKLKILTWCEPLLFLARSDSAIRPVLSRFYGT